MPSKPRPAEGATTARRLRNKQTDAERRLWFRLRARQILGVKFRRQQPIGSFIVDFCSLDPKLIIEVDGGQHAQQREADRERSAFLMRSGYRVLRFWNHEVLNQTDAVLDRIAAELKRLVVDGKPP